jgi:hypothetical protein
MSHNRYGYYLRNRVKPTNPSSPRQQEIRTIMAECSQRWSGTLTSDQRAGWEVYASNIARYNRIGSTIYLTGHAMYVSCNSARIYAGLDAVDDAPTILTLPEVDGSLAATANEGGQQISIAFDDTREWCSEDDAAMTLQMSMPSGAGTNYNMGPFRHLGVILGNSTPPTSPATLDTVWPVAQGQLITVQARIIRADGRLTQPFRDTSRVAD